MVKTEKNRTANLMEVLETCRKNNITIEELIEDLKNEIEKVTGKVEGKNDKKDNQVMEIKISNFLKELGISPNLLGYEYLKTAILLSLKNKNYLYSVTKTLYPDIAKMKGSTSSRVERAIRHAIETAWAKGNAKKFDEIFSYTISPDKGKPTNSAFIATIVEELELANVK